MKQENKSTINLLNKAVDIIKDKKGENIVSLKFSVVESSICDYFLICEASNERQVKAISDALQRELKSDLNEKVVNVEGYDTSKWILLDYLDVIIHVFHAESRDFYGLEKLWADTEIKKY